MGKCTEAGDLWYSKDSVVSRLFNPNKFPGDVKNKLKKRKKKKKFRIPFIKIKI